MSPLFAETDPIVLKHAAALADLSAEDLKRESARRVRYLAAGILSTSEDVDGRAFAAEVMRRTPVGIKREPIWFGSFPDLLVDLTSLDALAIDFEAIARRLARIPRFVGATQEPYSVAQHSVLVMNCTARPYRPWAILHDAHEAFLGDLTFPAVQYVAAIADEIDGSGAAFKRALAEAKRRIDSAIFAAAGLGEPSAECASHVEASDLFALRTELQTLLELSPETMRLAGHETRNMPACFRPTYWSAEKAESEFLAALRQQGII